MKRKNVGGLNRTVRTLEDYRVGMGVLIKNDHVFGVVTKIEGNCVVVKEDNGGHEGGWYPDSLLPKAEWYRALMQAHEAKARSYRELMFREDLV